MSPGAYPISKLIQKIISESGLKPSEFVARLGYKNVAKGLRRLNELLQDGSADEGFLQRIFDAFHPDHGEFERAILDTQAAHERERNEAVREVEERLRREFEPFIWIHTQDSAHSLFAAMAERSIKVLWFRKGFDQLSRPDQLAAAQRRIREHYQETGGKTGFGNILRYQWADSFDTSIILDVQGNVIEPNGGQFMLPEVWLELH